MTLVARTKARIPAQPRTFDGHVCRPSNSESYRRSGDPNRSLSRYAWRIIEAAIASVSACGVCRPRLRRPLRRSSPPPAWRSASCVDRRSSQRCTGNPRRSSTFDAKARARSVCALDSPLMDKGKPMTMASMPSSRTYASIADNSWPSTMMLCRGSAKEPSGSEIATPIRRSPASSPRMRVKRPASPRSACAPPRGPRPASRRRRRRPAPARAVRRRCRLPPAPRHERHRPQAHASRRPVWTWR